MIRTVLLDVDGTLIDSNDAHAAAWVEALKEQGIDVEFDVVRERIGMGGDHLLPSAVGLSEDNPVGKKASERRGEIFRSKYLSTLKPFPGTRELIEKFLEAGLELIVATSAPKEDLTGLLKQAGIEDLLSKFTSSDDAEKSKPSPDIIEAALKKSKSPPEQTLMLGDTPYDISAAIRAKVKTVAFTCGGWPRVSLGQALAIYEGPWDLLKQFEQSPFVLRGAEHSPLEEPKLQEELMNPSGELQDLTRL